MLSIFAFLLATPIFIKFIQNKNKVVNAIKSIDNATLFLFFMSIFTLVLSQAIIPSVLFNRYIINSNIWDYDMLNESITIFWILINNTILYFFFSIYLSSFFIDKKYINENVKFLKREVNLIWLLRICAIILSLIIILRLLEKFIESNFSIIFDVIVLMFFTLFIASRMNLILKTISSNENFIKNKKDVIKNNKLPVSFIFLNVFLIGLCVNGAGDTFLKKHWSK